MKRSIAALACAASLALASAASAHDDPAAHAAPTASAGNVRAEFVANLADVEKKVVALAEATPAEKYAWRPTAGVRSVSEVYMHIVGGNYFLPTFTGYKAAMPEGMGPDAEKKITDKAKVVEMLKGSFASLHKAIDETPDAKLDEKVKTFLGEQSVRAVFLLAVSHVHEHLGQSIAYARMNGIAPPWSDGPPAATQDDAKKGVQQADAKDADK